MQDDTIRGWAAAAAVAGRSAASLRKLVAAGRLQSQTDADGVHLFQRADVLALPPVQAGAQAAPPAPVQAPAEVQPVPAPGATTPTLHSDGGEIAAAMAELSRAATPAAPPSRAPAVSTSSVPPDLERRMAAIEKRLEDLADVDRSLNVLIGQVAAGLIRPAP